MITERDIQEAFKVTIRNKRRSADCISYAMYAERNLARLLHSIRTRSLAPTAYTFVTMKPRPREVFACDMDMRIIHHYIDMRLRPLLERRMTSRTYNNRVGYGPDAAVDQLISDIYEVSAGFSRNAWIVTCDLAGYFPNASQDIAYKQLSRVVLEDYEGEDKGELLYMLQAAIFSYPTRHCWRKSPLWKWARHIAPEKSLFSKPDGIGAAIGHLIWQNGMNYYLNDLDRWILGNLCPHYIRFVDDMCFVVENKEAFLPWLQVIRARLAEVGCRLHPKKFYCQHWSKGVNFIGSTVKADRVYPSERIVRRAFQKVRQFNRCPRASKLHTFISSVNSYLGMFKRRNAYGLIRNLMDKVSGKWWKMCAYIDERRLLVPLKGFAIKEITTRKYNLKFNCL